MASIIERADSKSETYRIRFRKKGFKEFHITFDDWDDACEWVEEHEHKFYEDPKYYFEWKYDLFLYMQKNKLQVHKHIIKPHIKNIS